MILVGGVMFSCGNASSETEPLPCKEIGIQLYSVRELIGVFGQNQQNYNEVLKQLAEMGYTSIETASYDDGKLYGQSPAQFRKDAEVLEFREKRLFRSGVLSMARALRL